MTRSCTESRRLRLVEASRNSPGPEEADKLIQPLLEGLTRPLTNEEKEKGRWAPKWSRILFEGTLEDAEEFYNQTENDARDCLIRRLPCTLTGLPVVIPTEERVARMLKGHQPPARTNSSPSSVTSKRPWAA